MYLLGSFQCWFVVPVSFLEQCSSHLWSSLAVIVLEFSIFSQFLQRPGKSPGKFSRFVLPELPCQLRHSFMYYLRQHLLQHLIIPRYSDSCVSCHFLPVSAYPTPSELRYAAQILSQAKIAVACQSCHSTGSSRGCSLKSGVDQVKTGCAAAFGWLLLALQAGIFIHFGRKVAVVKKLKTFSYPPSHWWCCLEHWNVWPSPVSL